MELEADGWEFTAVGINDAGEYEVYADGVKVDKDSPKYKSCLARLMWAEGERCEPIQ